jgi:hypothetical protein
MHDAYRVNKSSDYRDSLEQARVFPVGESLLP